jgi:hypothetical protein
MSSKDAGLARPSPPAGEDDDTEGEAEAQAYISGQTETLVAQNERLTRQMVEQAADLGRKDAELERQSRVITMQQHQLLEATNTVDYLTKENARLKAELTETQRAARQAETGWTLERGGIIEENRTLRDRIAELREGAA